MNGKQARALRKIAELNTDGDEHRARAAKKIIKQGFKQYKKKRK